MDDIEFPRWLYKGNDLALGIIVKSREELDKAIEEGFSEYGEPAPEQSEPATVKRGPGRPRKQP